MLCSCYAHAHAATRAYSMLHLIIDAGCICTQPLLWKVLTCTDLPQLLLHQTRVHQYHFAVSRPHFTSLWYFPARSMLHGSRSICPFSALSDIPMCGYPLAVHNVRYWHTATSSGEPIFGTNILLPPNFWRRQNSNYDNDNPWLHARIAMDLPWTDAPCLYNRHGGFVHVLRIISRRLP